MKLQKYSPELKLKALTLALRLGNVKASEQTGIARSTIYRWLHSDNPDDQELVRQGTPTRDSESAQSGYMKSMKLY